MYIYIYTYTYIGIHRYIYKYMGIYMDIHICLKSGGTGLDVHVLQHPRGQVIGYLIR